MPSRARPNVLLVVLDSARADAFEPYGAPPGASPTVARLAERGRAIRDVFATASWTVPSHASLFTGLLPRAAGAQGLPGMAMADTAPALRAHSDRNLAEVLRRAGYDTGAVSANLWISETSGFATGFEDFVSIDSGRQARVNDGAAGRLGWAVEAARARTDDGTAEAGRTLRRWIEDAPDEKPWFRFVNLIECHSPYLPPRPYNHLGPLARIRAAAEARRHLNLTAIWRTCVGGAPVPEAALERMRSLYAAAVRYQDAWLDSILEALARRGVLESTVVIVTADHGENLGEAGLITHALSLDDRLLRVPLVIAGPRAADAPDIRSLAELPRLIAELAAIENHPWPADSLPRGAAVAQLDPPADSADPRTAELLADWGLGEVALRRLTSPQACATDGRWKLLRRGGEELLFDVVADPLEQDPIALGDAGSENGSPPAGSPDAAPLSTLRAALEHPAAQRPDRRPGAPQPEEPSAQEVERLEERMRMLGYL